MIGAVLIGILVYIVTGNFLYGGSVFIGILVYNDIFQKKDR